MRQLRFWLNILLVLIPLGFIGIGAWRLVNGVFGYFNSGARLAGVLSREATQALGREVRVGNVRITGNIWSLYTTHNVELTDVFLADANPDQALVQADKVLFQYNLAQILLTTDRQVPYINELTLIHPQAHLARDAQGHWNFESLIKPSTKPGRPFLNRIAFSNGTLLYSDQRFPHPANVPAQPLATRVDNANGGVFIYPDKSASFDVTGRGEPRLVQNFHAVGLFDPVSKRVDARLTATNVNLPFVGNRLLPAAKGTVASGTANLNVSIVTLPPGSKTANGLIPGYALQGSAQIANLTANLPNVTGPIQNVSGTVALLGDSARADLTGQIAQTPLQINGSVFGLGKRDASGKPAPVLAAKIVAPSADFARILRALPPSALVSLSPNVRAQLRRFQGQGNLNLQVAGALDNPTATVTANLNAVQYDHYQASGVTVNALLVNHVIHAQLSGRYAAGNVVARGQVTTDKSGAFQVEAHGRDIDIGALGVPTRQTLGGKGRIDVVVTGRRGRTPDISAQAQVSNIKIDRAAFRTAYARAQTIGPNLVLRTLRVEDPKGVALARGTLNLKTQRLNITLDADQIDLRAIARVFRRSGLPSVALSPSAAPNVPGIDTALLNPQYLNRDPNAVGGIAYLRGKIDGTLKAPRLSGRVSSFALELGKVGLDKLVADFRLSHDLLTISQGRAERYLGLVRFSGAAADLFTKKPDLSFTVNVDKLDLIDLLDQFGIESNKIAVTGTLSTDDVLISGTPGDLIVTGAPDPATGARRPATLYLEDATLNGEAVKNTTLEVALNETGLHVPSVTAQMAGGTLTGSGRIEPDGALNFQLHGDSLQLEPLLAILPLQIDERFKGTVGFDATATGTTTLLRPLLKSAAGIPPATEGAAATQLKIAATAHADNLAVNDFALGSLQGSATYADSRVQITDVQLNRGPAHPDEKITVPSLAYNARTGGITGHIDWQKLSVQQLRELFQAAIDPTTESGQRALDMLNKITGPMEGTISGEVALSGTTDDPQAALSLTAADVGVAGYPTVTITGKARIDRKQVVVPDAQLESAKENVVIVAKDVLFEYGGKISADLTAYNVNLGVLQTLLPPATDAASGSPNVPRQLHGTGDFGLVARGTTAAPELTLSINLRDVAYADPTLIAATTGTGPLAQQARDRLAEQSLNRVDFTGQTADSGPGRNAAGEPVTKSRLVGSLRILKQGTVNAKPVDVDLRANGSLAFLWQPPYVEQNAALDIHTGDPDKPVLTLSLDAIALLVRTIALNLPEKAPETKATAKPTAVAVKSPTAPVAPNLLGDSQGQIQVEAGITGTRRRPHVAGSLAVHAARLRLADFATGLQNVDGTLNFEDDRITVVPGFHAESKVFAKGKPSDNKPGTPILVDGSLPLGLGDETQAAATGGIHVSAASLAVAESPLPGATTGSAKGTADVDLRIMGTALQPILRGDLTARDTQVVLPRDFGSLAENRPPPVVDPRFALNFHLGRNVRLVNPQLNARIDGDLNLGGSLSAPRLQGNLTLQEGRLTLPTARFTILPPGHLRLLYPSFEENLPGQPLLDISVDLQAQTYLTATSLGGVRKRYRVTVTAHGPISGVATDPLTGQPLLSLNFQTDPPDLASSQQALTQRLAGILGGDVLGQLGRNPGAALAEQLTNVFTSSVLPGLFDRTAEQLGFEELAIGYDPIQHLNITISRQIVGPLYVSYFRSLSGLQEMYDLKVSLRFKERYQLSYDVNEQHTQQILLEGVWRF